MFFLFHFCQYIFLTLLVHNISDVGANLCNDVVLIEDKIRLWVISIINAPSLALILMLVLGEIQV